MSATQPQTEITYEWRIQYYIYEFGIEEIEKMSQVSFGISATKLDEKQCDKFYWILRDKELAARKVQPCITCGKSTKSGECIACHNGMTQSEYYTYHRKLAQRGLL
jgi:hypothetical protein